MPSSLLTPISPPMISTTQAVALGGVGGVALIELLKDVRPDFGTDAAAGVRDLYHSVLIFDMELQSDRTALLGKLDGVGKEIVPYEGEQLRVALYIHTVFHVRLYFQILSFPGVFKPEQAFAVLLAQVEALLLRKDLLVFQLVELEDVGD